MSEMDPWALPAAGTAAGQAGIPGAPYRAQPVLAQPLNRRLPLVVLGFGVLYILVSFAEVFALHHRASLASLLAAGGEVTEAQGRSADRWVTDISTAALIVFIGTLIAIGFWRRSLNATLGSIGAHQAVFKRAGYVYFRAAWVASLALSFILNASTNGSDLRTLGQVVSHDHAFMYYYGLRSLVGVVLIVFAVRLKRISEEAVQRLIGSIAGARG